MHLIDDEDTVFATLRRCLHQVGDVAYVVDTIVGGGIELHHNHVDATLYCLAVFAFTTCLAVGRRVETVDGLCKNSRTRSLADATWPTEEICLRQTIGSDGILQCGSQGFLPHHTAECGRPVLACAYYIIIHNAK